MTSFKTQRVGEVKRANNGLLMTIITYRNEKDIDIQFEDGYVKEHARYSMFKAGTIRHPGIRYGEYATFLATHPTVQKQVNDRVGQTTIANNGQEMTIIAYSSSLDIDVQFSDGTIVEHTRYDCFKDGRIRNPNYQTIDPRITRISAERIGKTNIATNGQQMRIVAYRTGKDMDVQFEDGTVVTTRYSLFLNGNVANPNYIVGKSRPNTKQIPLSGRVGESNITKEGLKITIVKYDNAQHIAVQFEDGMTVTTSYARFLNKQIIHPYHYSRNLPKDLKMQISQVAYVYNGICNFYCKCKSCGAKDILSIAEMREHKCIAQLGGI